MAWKEERRDQWPSTQLSSLAFPFSPHLPRFSVLDPLREAERRSRVWSAGGVDGQTAGPSERLSLLRLQGMDCMDTVGRWH